jgi:hypothetical protein
MATPLDEAIDMAVRGEFPPGTSELDGHEFYIRALNNKGLIAEDETCYFRHEHVGKDDRVFFKITIPGSNGRPYEAKLTRIQFRGPFVQNGFRDMGDTGIDVTDAVAVIAAAGTLTNLPAGWIPFLLLITELDVQGFLDGQWVPAAAKIADMIGARMAQG